MTFQALEQAAQGGGADNIPGSVQEMRERGTHYYGLVDMLVFCQRLGSTTLEVFLNLNDSMKYQLLNPLLWIS